MKVIEDACNFLNCQPGDIMAMETVNHFQCFEYQQKDGISFHDIVEFHYYFEKIHPFQDGNGRVGRFIIFKEC